MSGFQPNMWRFKKPKPSPTTLPTTNKFWQDIDADDENAASESKEDENNKAGDKTETQNFPSSTQPDVCQCPTANMTYIVGKPPKGRKCFVCRSSDHVKKDCTLKHADNRESPSKPTEENKTDSVVSSSKPTEENKTGSEVSPTAAESSNINSKDSGGSGKPRKPQTCYKCRGQGHLGKACPFLQTQPKDKKSNMATTMCMMCKKYGHKAIDCPLNPAKRPENPPPLDKPVVASKKSIIPHNLCMMCKQFGHKAIDCPLNPASRNKKNNKKNENQSSLKPVLASIEKLIKENKCTYCGVAGHFIQACPVKKWRINPGASDGDTDFKEEFISFADGEKPEPPNPTLAAAGAPGKVGGNNDPPRTSIEINRAIAKKEKELKKKRARAAKLLARKQQEQMAWMSSGTLLANAVNLPQPRPPVPVTFINHPNANIKIPVKQSPVPIGQPTQPITPNMANPYMPRPFFPSGIPRSFLIQQHQEQLLQQNTTQQGSNNVAQPNQQPNFTWPQAPAQTSVPIDQHSPTGFVPIQQDSMDSEKPQAYSPSDVYGDMRNESGSTEPHEGSESPDPHGQKRLSAFQRLGPATQKKPKLTINLSCNKGQAVREVVDETTELVEEHPPVHLRSDVTTSTDDTVMKYLYFWPWKKTVPIRRTATFKSSKSAMLLEQEQMEESYDKDNVFMQISVTNYPKTWSKEEVFDVLLEQVNLIPCFIEFTSKECKFLVIRSKPALLSIHKMGFKIRKEDIELVLKISVTLLTLNQIDFLPRLILRKRLVMGYDGEQTLNLQQFTLKSDISHFVYFPLNRLPNQTELIQMQSVVDWERLTELNLSHNRLTSIDGFHLTTTCPNLKILDVSYNFLDKVTALLRCRYLPLHSLCLEGNPLCHDYTDPKDYVRLVRMLFPTVRILDGVTIQLKGDLPTRIRNHCLHGSENIVEKYLDTFYPLLEAQPADRQLLEDMYDENALMTILYRYKFIHRLFRIASSSSRSADDGIKDAVNGATAIAKHVNKWPAFKHDPFTFTVDVLFHCEHTTIVKVCGILKLTAESLAEDEYLISFSRTTVLHSRDGVEYNILNEMILWDEPSKDCHSSAFQITKIRSKKLYVDLEFDSEPDDETKEKLVVIFEHLTELDRHSSRKCLERKDWNLRSALDNFIQLLKLNDLSSISG